MLRSLVALWASLLLCSAASAGCAPGPLIALAPELRSDAAPSDQGTPSLKMRNVCNNVWLDDSLSGRAEAQRLAALAHARTALAERLQSSPWTEPLIVFCASFLCDAHFLGGELRSRALGVGHSAPRSAFTAQQLTVLLNSQESDLGGALLHEWIHVEVHQRLGQRSHLLPSWFNEGLATVWSNYPLCEPALAVRETLLDGLGSVERWNAATRTDRSLYCEAAVRVRRWTAARGGNAAVTRLLAELARGAVFSERFEAKP